MKIPIATGALIIAAALSGGCSTEGPSAESFIVDGNVQREADSRAAQFVGASPPDCGASGEAQVEIAPKTRYAKPIEDEPFALDFITYEPVYCASHDIKTLISAAREAIASMPELCDAVESLPKGWNLPYSEPPEELIDKAVARWVEVTDGGPISELGGNFPDTRESPDSRYFVSKKAMMVATDHYCPK